MKYVRTGKKAVYNPYTGATDANNAYARPVWKEGNISFNIGQNYCMEGVGDMHNVSGHIKPLYYP